MRSGTLPLVPTPLPLAGERPRRSDALRNRERVLAAARRLFSAQGVAAVRMTDIAREAGVGTGTLYRGFGDKAGLARELLDDAERSLQDRFLRGRPPLGPGAPPADRLAAFGVALLRLLDRHGDLVLLSEGGSAGARFSNATYASFHAHVAMLVREARPDSDDVLLAHIFLAPLAADLQAQLALSGAGLRRRERAVRELARGLLLSDG